MTAYKLYDGALPHENVETSIEAARSMQGEPSDAIRSKVLQEITTAGSVGLTCDEVEVLLGLRHQTASARMRELYLMGKITSRRDAKGLPAKRRTRSGRNALVWLLARKEPPIQARFGL